MTKKTLTAPLRRRNTLQQKQLSSLANAVCNGASHEYWSQSRFELAEETIELLIESNPSCLRWASIAVDQLTAAMEKSW